MRILPGNAQHIGSRHSQQDSFGFADPGDRAFLAHGGFLAVVCDGMGGMEHGDAASRAAVRAFLDAYQRKTPEESIPQALERGVREANREVVSLASQLNLVENMGTTLVAAVLLPGAMHYVSVGDSALFVVSGGKCRMVNHPHVFANLLERAVERGVMSREDADNHPERESLTSFIGAENLEEIDRNVEPDEIEACLHGAPQSWPETLVALTLAKHREHQDNVTVLSVTMDEGVDEPAPQESRTEPENTVPFDARRTMILSRSAVDKEKPQESPACAPVAQNLAPQNNAPQSPSPENQTPPPAQDWTPAAPAARAVASRPASARMLITSILAIALAVVLIAAGWRWHASHQPAAKPDAATKVPPPGAAPQVPSPGSTDQHAPPHPEAQPPAKAD